jgi:hypothetical protein
VLHCDTLPIRPPTVEFRAGRVRWLHPFQVIWRRILQALNPVLSPPRLAECLPCLIIRLIIQTILLDPSGAVWTDGPAT